MKYVISLVIILYLVAIFSLLANPLPPGTITKPNDCTLKD